MNQQEVIPTTANWNAVYSLTIGVAALIIAEFLPVGVLTPLAKDLQVTEGVAGRAVTATSVFAVLTSLLIAYLTRNFNRRTVLLGLSSLLTASSAIVAFSPNFELLLLGRVLLGISLGGFWSMAAAITIRLVPEKDVPKALAIIFGGSSFASVLAAPMGSYLGNILGWRNVFLIAALVGLSALMWQVMALPKLKPLGNTRLRTIIDVCRIPEFLYAMLAVAFVFCGRFASFTYLRPFLEKTTGLSVNLITVALLVFGLSYFVGNAFAPGMMRRNLKNALAFPPLILGIVAVGLISLGSEAGPTFFLIFLWGAVFGPVAPSWSTWVTRKVPEYAETAGGIYIASIQGAAAIGSLIGGFVYDHNGPSGVFIMSGVSWVLSALVIILKISIPNKTINMEEIAFVEKQILSQE